MRLKSMRSGHFRCEITSPGVRPALAGGGEDRVELWRVECGEHENRCPPQPRDGGTVPGVVLQVRLYPARAEHRSNRVWVGLFQNLLQISMGKAIGDFLNKRVLDNQRFPLKGGSELLSPWLRPQWRRPPEARFPSSSAAMIVLRAPSSDQHAVLRKTPHAQGQTKLLNLRPHPVIQPDEIRRARSKENIFVSFLGAKKLENVRRDEKLACFLSKREFSYR
ncbi:hypothetical protein RRG08_031328 [Elysia crispata]|uniref:Uncharacterized protein n=1 Tax=Elysia crispata TaxID=231223 RepID=A0AAE0YJA9_9GAST|nr:hypothetical protein RRG08_031328 [Elysia crispata]